MPQTKNKLDKETIKKILRSLLYCLISGTGAGLVSYSQTQDATGAILVGLGALGTMIVTFTKEWKAGE